MAVKAVESTLNNKKNNAPFQAKTGRNVAFKGAENLIVTTMDAIERGGFAASFIVQDQLGAAWPRILAGTTRNKGETGKTNWNFAAMEAMRELLSGPSTFILPAIVLGLTKKAFGTANAVPIRQLQAYGDSFREFIKTQPPEIINDSAALKSGFYEHTFKNMLDTSIDGAVENIDVRAKEFANRLIEIEKAPKKPFLKKMFGKKVEGSADDLLAALKNDISELKKGANSVLDVGTSVKIKYSKGTLSTNLNTYFKNIKNYTTDVTKTLTKKVKKGVSEPLETLAENFKFSRIGTRFITNFAMIVPVFMFLKYVPKLYKSLNKSNPGLQGLDEKVSKTAPKQQSTADETSTKIQTETDKKAENGSQPSFTGAMSSIGRTLSNKSKFLKVFDKCEFEGFMASIPAMTAIMYGGALVPRFINAYDKHDRREILVRDLASMTAVLYLARAMIKVFSEIFQKTSGFVLNLKPEKHKGTFRKIWNYANPMSDLHVLNSEQLASKYSQIENFKGGITGFCEFIEKGGGDLKRVLSSDKQIQAAAEKITKNPLKNLTANEIKTALKNSLKSKDKKPLEELYRLLSNPNNNLVKRAKTMNSAFGFVSTIILVPGMMIFLSKFNERLTKRVLAKEKEQAKAEKTQEYNDNIRLIKNARNSANPQQQKTYAAFLGK